MHNKGNQVKRLIGAMGSGHPAVYTALLIRIIAPFTKFLDNHLTWRKPSRNMRGRIIFVTCPPRSGGTVLFQALSSALPSVFLSNLHAISPNLGRNIQHRHPYCPKKFESFNGYTANLLDVYEGNEFLEWLHFFSDESVIQKEFALLISKLEPRANEVVVIKNARAASQIEKLSMTIPEILFVRVKRDTATVIESSLNIYHKTGIFHPIPNNLRAKKIEDPLEFAVKQITEIEFDLDRQFEKVPPDRQITVSYETFCDSPDLIIEQIAYDYLKLPNGSIKQCKARDQLKPSSHKKVSDKESVRIRKLLSTSQIL